MFSLEDVLHTLALEQVGTDRYRASSVRVGPVVFGGQLLAQSIVAASQGQEGKAVKTLHTVFARGASPEEALDVSVDRMHAGRNLASTTVTFTQSGKVCARSSVLLSADEPELIRHADKPEATELPGEAEQQSFGAWQVRIVGAVDVNDPDAVGPPELGVWVRCAGAPDDALSGRALLAFITEGFLIGTAMRPHPGVGQSQAHVTLSTGVLSHTLTFHEPLRADEWLLLSNTSPYAGHGRCYGRADVFRENGELVASMVQDAMIRPMGQQRPGGL